LISKRRIVENRMHPVPDLPARGTSRARIEIVPQNRGFLNFLGLDIARTDPLGLRRTLCSLSAPQKVVVLPKRYRVPPLPLPGRRRHHAGEARRAAAAGHLGEFVSLRNYRPGDNPRQIHWKSSAKRNELIVKEYREEFQVRQALILDTFADTAHSERFEEAVSIAASFVGSQPFHESILDLIFVGDRAYRFSSGRGASSSDYLLEILAAVRTCRDQRFDAIGPPVFEHIHLFSGCICVLLAWDAPRQAFIRGLRDQGVQTLVLVVTEERTAAPIDPGPMQDAQDRFFVLTAGRIEEGLAGL
jgi:hypothetical protein